MTGWPQLRYPSTLGDFTSNGADPMLADLAGAPSAVLSGASAPPSTLQNQVSQWMSAVSPGSLDQWLTGAGATAAAAIAGGPAAGAMAASQAFGQNSSTRGGGWWSQQSTVTKGLITVAAIGLILIGVAALFFGHGGGKAVEAAAA